MRLPLRRRGLELLSEPPTTVHVVPDGTRPARIDSYLTNHGIAPSRSRIRQLVDEGLITVDGKAVRPSHKVHPGARIAVTISAPTPLAIEPEALPLEVVYEDDAIAVINKPPGMAVHPAPGHWEGTLVHALLHHLKGLSGIGGRERPGIVHRLDKDTSGLLVVAKTDAAHGALSASFKAHKLDRRYRALVLSVPKPAYGTIDVPLGRDRKQRKKISPHADRPRRAVTHYRTLETFNISGKTASLLELKLETGRTHQIRVHLTHIGCPVLGDAVYGGGKKLPGIPVPRQMLHAARLVIEHPVTGERMTFEMEPPDDFQRVLAALRERTP